MTTTSVEPDRTLYPPRWQPAPLRWHRTRVSWWESWKLAAQVIPRRREGTLADFYGSQLPGEDDIMLARMPFQRYVMVRNPELARHVLVTNQDNYSKSAEYDMLAVAFGRGLVTETNVARWQRNRRLVQPVFGKRNIAALAGPITDAARECAQRLLRLGADGAVVDANAEMNRLTLDIVVRTMFGVELAGPMEEITFTRMLGFFGFGFVAGTARPLHRLAELTHRHHLPMRVMRTSAWILAPRMMSDLRHVERVIDRLIADHRSGVITRRDNLLALLMEAVDPETGHRYTDAEIHDELMTFIGAGMETTATALAWTWKMLAEHPEVRARLHAELDDVLGGRTPTAEDVDLLPWTRAVVAETMRLYPPVVGLARVAKGDDLLGDFPIRAGATVIVGLHEMHHHSRVWANPEIYDPARYLAEHLTAAQRHATLPFGAGKRMCVAHVFANTEAVLALATIAQQLELNSATTDPIRPQFSFTGGPDGPIPMFAAARTAEAAAVDDRGSTRTRS
ncbi:cytochrome P450 [Nocardia sp. ET3-3]|uniref:Cytochrome P450 n=1 Tax=Nocardia terrae TaxID=2675851 RepID=A0A7K1USR6_9NOCA|nr:cytochrome P450 [Nocardia terrae]MVU77392.1 cytochrome P450 [Nocardia terrae]